MTVPVVPVVPVVPHVVGPVAGTVEGSWIPVIGSVIVAPAGSVELSLNDACPVYVIAIVRAVALETVKAPVLVAPVLAVTTAAPP